MLSKSLLSIPFKNYDLLFETIKFTTYNHNLIKLVNESFIESVFPHSRI